MGHFKAVNDTYGHPVGDKVLLSTANTINQLARKNDLTGRFGGEELVMVLPDTSIELAITVAEQIRLNIESTQQKHDNHHFSVTISIGVARASKGEDPTSLISRADKALYTAKKNGRNRVEFVV